MLHQTAPIAAARLKTHEVPAVYRRVAPVYDVWAGLTESRARRRCLARAAPRNGESILEVAVGTGQMFAALLAANPEGRNEGLDLTPAMLHRACGRAAGVAGARYRLALGDARALDYPAATFDLLVNNYMFDLLPEGDFPGILGEFFRVLKPGGRLALVNMTTPWRWPQRLWGLVYRVNPAWLGGCRGVRLAPHLAAAGFRRVVRETVSQLTFPSEVVTAVKPPVS